MKVFNKTSLGLLASLATQGAALPVRGAIQSCRGLGEVVRLPRALFLFTSPGHARPTWVAISWGPHCCILPASLSPALFLPTRKGIPAHPPALATTVAQGLSNANRKSLIASKLMIRSSCPENMQRIPIPQTHSQKISLPR